MCQHADLPLRREAMGGGWLVGIAALALVGVDAVGPVRSAPDRPHDVVIRNGIIYDGSGAKPYAGDLAVDGERISYVGPHRPLKGHLEIDARGNAVSPGFIDMMGHSEESLLIDGRSVSGLKQGVTLEVLPEESMGPLNPAMVREKIDQQGDLKYQVDWTTVGEYLARLERQGISPNVASYVGEAQVRVYVLGEHDVAPSPAQLDAMRSLVHQAMEQGALGLTTELEYAPNYYAKTPELIEMAKEAARCGGIYAAHIRSEADRIEEGVQESIDIARASGAPAEIFHLKMSGRGNWGKLDKVVSMIETARASGVRITADMYTYTAGATWLDASLPPWVHDGGARAMSARLQEPAVRAKVIAAMRDPHTTDWENLYQLAGPDAMRILAMKKDSLKPLIGKTIAQVAQSRGVSAEDAIIDLVIADGVNDLVAYTLMSEANLPRELKLPWVSLGSDAESSAAEGVFLKFSAHPRAYGNFARLFAKYVREDHVISVQEAVRKLTSLPADVLSLEDRGRLRPGAIADIVVFDPDIIQDHSTYQQPLRYATGVSDVLVNGRLALKGGEPTGTLAGRIVRGRAWTGRVGGGCRAGSGHWGWVGQAVP